jgi:hypothetical protein
MGQIDGRLVLGDALLSKSSLPNKHELIPKWTKTAATRGDR